MFHEQLMAITTMHNLFFTLPQKKTKQKQNKISHLQEETQLRNFNKIFKKKDIKDSYLRFWSPCWRFVNGSNCIIQRIPVFLFLKCMKENVHINLVVWCIQGLHITWGGGEIRHHHHTMKFELDAFIKWTCQKSIPYVWAFQPADRRPHEALDEILCDLQGHTLPYVPAELK